MTSTQAGSARYGFIHIPKSAGTSISRAITDCRLPIKVVDHDYPAKITDEEIAVIRDPAGRFVSAFNYSRRYWPSPINSQFEDANELAESAYDPEHPKHALALVEMGNRPEHYLQRSGRRKPPHRLAGRVLDFTYVYEPQSSWLINQPAHLLRFRYLQSDFHTLLLTIGLQPGTDLPMLNPSDGSRPFLTDNARAFIERTYAADYRFIRSHELDV